MNLVGLASGAGSAQEILETDGAGTTLRRYVRLPGSVDEVLLMIDYTLDATCTNASSAPCERWAHANRLGSVVAVTDSTGAVVEKYRYSPYGVSGAEGTAGFPFRFTGQKLDPETGLYYYKARYYDPETGRFLQTDPIGYDDQMNLYAYVHNDPVNATDPTGEIKISIGINAELVVKLGLRGGINLSFDTETLEVGASVTVGGRAGLSAGVGVSGSITESGAEAQNSLDAAVALNVDANIGPVSVGTDIVSASTRDGVQVLEGQSVGATLENLSPKLKPQLKAGGSVGIDVTVEGTTSVISDVIDVAAETAAAVDRGVRCAFGGSCD